MLFAVLLIAITSAGCGAPQGAANSSADRTAALQRIAADYAQDNDLNRAKTALAVLKLANPGQVVLSRAEQAVQENASRDDVAQLANLATALGARSQQLVAYLAPATTAVPAATVAPPDVPPATATALPVPTQAPAATAPATATLAPSSTPVKPHVSAAGTANLRSGPGTAYPVIGQMAAGQELAILARNDGGDWWRVAYASEEQAWVSSQVVTVVGGTDVAVAQDVSAPPPTAIPAPTQPPAAPVAAVPPTKAPPSGVQYVVQTARLRSLAEGQNCHGGNHGEAVLVTDAAGNPLNNVRVKDLELERLGASDAIQVTGVTGNKGAGRVEFTFGGNGGGGQLVILDDAGNQISEVTRSLSNAWPDFDMLSAAGYCSCESLDTSACQLAVQTHSKMFAYAHYFYDVVFRRTY